MKILYLSDGTLADNEKLNQGFCNKYKDTKVGSMRCQQCKFFSNSNCLSIKNIKS